jgi:hypothetical protein
MASPACAPRPPIKVEVPVPVAVKVKDTPPAALLACADRPAGLPEDPALVAQIPTRARAGIIRLARAFGANANQLDRLIDWIAPGSCLENKK